MKTGRGCRKALRKSSALLAVLIACAPAPYTRASVNRRTPVVTAVEKSIPSVVNIGTERMVKVRYSDPFRRFRGNLIDQFFSEYFGPPPLPGYRIGHSLGSGVIVHPDGYILTNYHVIERASRILVTLADETAYDAVVLAGDEISDLALIRIFPEKPLTAVDFAADGDLLLGETVIVLGNPFGLTHTVTVGVLSAKDRPAMYRGEVLFRDILQTDAAVNPGSSGGPLLNLDGDLIGVNVAIYQEAQNIGFAIPVKRVRALLGEWLAPKLIRKLWLGADVEARDGSVVVAQVHRESPSVNEGLSEGDVILGVDDQPVRSLYEYNAALLQKEAGDIFEVTVLRDGTMRDVLVSMDVVPKPSGSKLALTRLGLEFSEADMEMEKRGQFKKGLLVADVEQDSAAQAAGLHSGQWVTRINNFEIQHLDDVGLALEYVRPGDPVTLVVVNVEERESFIMAQSSAVQLTAK